VKRVTFLFLSLVFSWVAFGNESTYLDANSAYDYLNHIRKSSGMIPLRGNRTLEKSAKNHAQYLTQNVLDHNQQQDKKSFTGITPADRAIYSGYHSKGVTENFSSGQIDSIASIDGLMSAIYHRFGFLDFIQNEVGIGIIDHKDGIRFVYNLGNRQLNELCQKKRFQPSKSYYSSICSGKKKTPANLFERAEEQTALANPDFVIWPPHEAKEISPVFYDEIPDPLPDLLVSGYPVSIQFNPLKYKRVRLIQFKLFTKEDQERALPSRLVTSKNDPNHKFTKFQFSLFPLKRLDWNTTYVAKVIFLINGEKTAKIWNFSTKNFSEPIFHISARGELINLRPDHDGIIYIPPTRDFPFFRNLSWEALPHVETFVSREDKNTLRIHVTGKECDEVRFKLDGKRSFKIILAGKNNWNKQQKYNKSQLIECIPPQIKGIEGFLISGNNETKSVKNGHKYWIKSKNEGNRFKDLRTLFLKGTKVSVERVNKNLILVQINGALKSKVDFKYGNQESFTLVISEDQK